jgi:hypothetical protein
MRGLRRAYDPHLAACRLAVVGPFAFGLGLGQYPSLRGGPSGESTPPSGSCFGRPMGMYLPFTGGAKSRVTRVSGFSWEHPWVWIVREGVGAHWGPGLVWGGA